MPWFVSPVAGSAGRVAGCGGRSGCQLCGEFVGQRPWPRPGSVALHGNGWVEALDAAEHNVEAEAVWPVSPRRAAGAIGCGRWLCRVAVAQCGHGEEVAARPQAECQKPDRAGVQTARAEQVALDPLVGEPGPRPSARAVQGDQLTDVPLGYRAGQAYDTSRRSCPAWAVRLLDDAVDPGTGNADGDHLAITRVASLPRSTPGMVLPMAVGLSCRRWGTGRVGVGRAPRMARPELMW